MTWTLIIVPLIFSAGFASGVFWVLRSIPRIIEAEILTAEAAELSVRGD